jgi:hypoxanthine phosphoribosyltransferase
MIYPLKYFAVLILFFYSSAIFAKNDLEIVITPEEISKRLTEIALEIDKDYLGQELTLVMVLKGSVVVTTDLMRKLKTPLTLEYIKSTTHDSNGIRTGNILLEGIEKLDIKGKNVLLLDDACGTGTTLSTIMGRLQEKQPKSIKSLVVVLFDVERKNNHFQPDYYLFKLKDRYLVGFGLDHKQRYRNLPGIYELKNYD